MTVLNLVLGGQYSLRGDIIHQWIMSGGDIFRGDTVHYDNGHIKSNVKNSDLKMHAVADSTVASMLSCSGPGWKFKIPLLSCCCSIVSACSSLDNRESSSSAKDTEWNQLRKWITCRFWISKPFNTIVTESEVVSLQVAVAVFPDLPAMHRSMFW